MCLSESCGTLLFPGALEVNHSFCIFDTHDSPRFVRDFINPRCASGRASGFSPGSGGVGRQAASGRVFPPSLRSLILTQVKFPFGGQKKKEEGMNKRLILAWKTLAPLRARQWGKSATLWLKCWGFLCRSGKGWKSVENWFDNLDQNRFRIAHNDWKSFFNSTWHCERIILSNNAIKRNLKSF